jgi:hypothetical protein
MSLSEREQRILDEIESSLIAEGIPNVVDPRSRKFVAGVLITLAGVGLLLTAVVLSSTLLGVGAFLVMLGGTYTASTHIPPRS